MFKLHRARKVNLMLTNSLLTEQEASLSPDEAVGSCSGEKQTLRRLEQLVG